MCSRAHVKKCIIVCVYTVHLLSFGGPLCFALASFRDCQEKAQHQQVEHTKAKKWSAFEPSLEASKYSFIFVASIVQTYRSILSAKSTKKKRKSGKQLKESLRMTRNILFS